VNQPQRLLEDLQFGESPRWRDDRLWFSDILDGKVYTVDLAGTRTLVADFGDARPSGIGFLPNGDALVVDMAMPGIVRLNADGSRQVHAHLGAETVALLNDMVVDAIGNAYVGSTGRNYFTGEVGARPANVILVRPDGTAQIVADNVTTPNGPVITPDGSTYIVAESDARRLTAFEILPDATLGERRLWADLGEVRPDGIGIDAEGGIWVASQTTKECVRVIEGGAVTDRIRFPHNVIACTLGGTDGHTLFVFGITGEANGPVRSSVLDTVSVAVGAALRPQ
jgi:sugar lactone lactonase YvrE